MRTRLVATAIVLVAVLVAVVLVRRDGATADDRGGFRLNAVVARTQAPPAGTPVRMLGVPVGTVTAVAVRGDGRTATVRIELRADAPAVRDDATLAVRPQAVLDGRLVVDLQPGGATAPKLADDATLPLTRTTVAVTTDELLAASSASVRRRLGAAASTLGQALTDDPQAAAARDHALVDTPAALRAATAAASALGGQQPDDLSRLVTAASELGGSLQPHARRLVGAVRGLDRATAALTADRGALAATLRELPPTLRRAEAAFSALDTALPGVGRLAGLLLPGVRESGAAIDAAFPWISAAERLTEADALPRLVDELTPTVPLLNQATAAGRRLGPPLDAAAMCVYKVLVPAAEAKVEDGKLTTGRELYKSLGYGLVGLAGVGQGSDANGSYLRLGSGLGNGLLDLGPNQSSGRLLSTTSGSPIGVRPVRPVRQPPHRTDRACDQQSVPDPNQARSAPGEASAVVGRARSAAAREQADADGAPRGLGASGDRLGTGLADRLNPLSGRAPTTSVPSRGGGR